MKLSPEIRKQVFLLDKPKAQPIVANNQLPNGDAAVIVLRSARENPVKDDQGKQIEAQQQKMLQAESQAQARLLLEYKRANSKIDINKQQDSDQES